MTGPRVTVEDIDANIQYIEYIEHCTLGGQMLRWAILTTRNGFAVVGQPSVAVSPKNDDEATGKKIALENSKRELWPLMGYALKEKLA